MRKLWSIVLIVFSLPILFHVYDPAWTLGGWGLALGFIGYTISPLILFVILIKHIIKYWRRDEPI